MSNCGLVEFSITDGTVVIDLLAANKHGAGFGVQSYVPGRPQLKDGGIWQDSNTEAGRKLVFGVNTNTVDMVTLICGAGSQSQIIEYFKTLDLLLDKMTAYWTTSWQPAPVYLRARAKGEGSTRYALINYAKYDEYFNPYGQLFAGNGFKVCTEEFAFGIEHELWLDLPPGEPEAAPITSALAGGDYFEDAEPIAESVTVANEGLIVGNSNIGQNYNTGGFTHIYREDGGVFSGNLISLSLPYNLYNSPVQTNDAFYLGSDYPFYGAVFDFSSAPNATNVITWEFWNGSAWTTMAIAEQTTTPTGSNKVLDNTGIRHVRWLPSTVATWTKVDVPVGSPFGQRYYVRARVSTGNNGSALTQINRHPYPTTNGYVEINAADIQGTKSALALIKMGTWHPKSVAGTVYRGVFARLGLRSVDRGENFSAYVNVGFGNVHGINTYGAATTNAAAPGGQYIEATNLSSFTDVARFEFLSHASAPVSEYAGQYRLFVRLNTTDDTGASQLRYQIRLMAAGGSLDTGEARSVPSGTLSYVVVDLGLIELPPPPVWFHQAIEGVNIVIQAIVPSGKTIQILGIVLLPVDEWTGEISGEITAPTNRSIELDLDAIQTAGRIKAYRPEREPLLHQNSAAPFLHAGATQRMWFLFSFGTDAAISIADPSLAATIQMYMVERNVGLR